MEDLLGTLMEYGPKMAYVILFLGSLVEGESVVLTAGYLAHKQFLYLPYVIGIAFVATVIADQALYFVGRIYGPTIFTKRPHWKEKVQKAFDLLHKYNTGFIFSFRFIYGIRVISPIIIGTSGISAKRFAILNILAAAVWAVVSCVGGYLIGYFFSDHIDAVFAVIIKSQKYLIGSILLLIVLWWGKRRWACAKTTS